MSTVNITSKNFQETIDKNDIVLIDYWADWCGPCKAFGPIFEKAAEENPGIVFGKCDTERETDLATAFRIRSIPTLMVFREQVLVFSQPGLLPKAALDELIQKVKELDMNKVRSMIDEEMKNKHPKQDRRAAVGGQ